RTKARCSSVPSTSSTASTPKSRLSRARSGMGWRDTAGPGHKIAKTTPCKVEPGIDRGVPVSKPRHDIRQRRARAILGGLCRRADMDEAGEFLVRLQAKPVEHVAVEREPAGEPVGAIAERGGGGDDV